MNRVKLHHGGQDASVSPIRNLNVALTGKGLRLKKIKYGVEVGEFSALKLSRPV